MKSENQDNLSEIRNLKERQKELNCLYRISEILKNDNSSIEDVLLNIIEAIPYGYQFPEICTVAILLNGKEFHSKNLSRTELKQSAQILTNERVIGEIQVYYIKPVKLETSPVFLNEEQQLLNTIAENISQFNVMNHYKELINQNNEISKKHQIPIELSSWFSDLKLKETEIEEILATDVDFNKGDIIFKQGTLVSYLVVLSDGMAKIHIEDLKGRSYIYKIVKPYELIGLSALFGKGNFGFTATAIQPSGGYLVKKETVKKLIRENSNFNIEILNRYSNNLNIAFQKMNFLANKQALGRLCETLIYLWRDIFDEEIIENTITRRIIAELSGMSTENAVRILSELKNDGIIMTGKDGIKVLNPELLETYSYAG